MSRIQPPDTDNGHHTLGQLEMEYAAAAAENARAGLLVPPREMVPVEVRTPLFELAAFLQRYVTPRILWSAAAAGRDVPVGAVLYRVRYSDVPDYVVVLQTHEAVDAPSFITRGNVVAGMTAPPQGPRQIIDDYRDPGPFDEHLTGARFEHAYEGLLRLLQRQLAARLADPEGWCWKTGETPEDSPADDPYWHPQEMLKRVRAWRCDLRRTKKRMLVVEKVHRG